MVFVSHEWHNELGFHWNGKESNIMGMEDEIRRMWIGRVESNLFKLNQGESSNDIQVKSDHHKTESFVCVCVALANLSK